MVYQLSPTHHPPTGSGNPLPNGKLSLSPTLRVEATSQRLLSPDVMSLLVLVHGARPEKVPRGGAVLGGRGMSCVSGVFREATPSDLSVVSMVSGRTGTHDLGLLFLFFSFL